MDADIFVPFVFFGFLAAIILVPILAKERTKRSAHDLVSQAMSRGQPLDPSLIQQLTSNMLEEGNRARKSLGNAVILLALAGGFIAAGFVMDGFDPGGDARHGMWIPAVILGSVGVAFLLLSIVDYATKKRNADA
jgi:type III secretory pathway component EscU